MSTLPTKSPLNLSMSTIEKEEENIPAPAPRRPGRPPLKPKPASDPSQKPNFPNLIARQSPTQQSPTQREVTQDPDPEIKSLLDELVTPVAEEIPDDEALSIINETVKVASDNASRDPGVIEGSARLISIEPKDLAHLPSNLGIPVCPYLLQAWQSIIAGMASNGAFDRERLGSRGGDAEVDILCNHINGLAKRLSQSFKAKYGKNN